MAVKFIPGATLVALIAACSTDTPQANAEAPANGIGKTTIAADWPASLIVIGDGYPQPGNACRRVGESAVTSDWLDDSADLVGCPTIADADALGGRIVGTVDGITIMSIPAGDANPGMGGSGPAEDRDAKVAGTDYHATAQVACSMVGGPTSSNCPAGVKRNPFGDGTNVVEVTRPSGMKRVIFFKDGKPQSADSAQSDGSAAYEFSFTQEGDEFLISYGPERYRIVEAFVYGG